MMETKKLGTRNSNACKMTGALRFVIFALVCAHAHAQCCQGTFTTTDGTVPVQPKDEAACKAAKDGSGSWQPTCTTGTSCMVMQCTGKMTGKDSKVIGPMCSTTALQTALADTWKQTVTALGATEVKCASGAPSSKFASAAVLMVSAFVSLVVGSV